jgi:hypothetical protein
MCEMSKHELDALADDAEAAGRLEEENERLRAALTALRSLVKEGGVPRYTVTPGAALNSVIEEVVDPALRATAGHDYE